MKIPRLSPILLLSGILAMACQGLWAQESAPASDELAGKLSKEERERIAEVTAQAQKDMRIAQAELDIIKAQLNRLLLSPDADMKEAEKLLRQALEWELKVRLAEIRREIEIRKIVGDRRWADIVQIRNRQSEAARTIITERVEAAIDRLVGQIVNLKLERANRDEVEKRLKNLLRQLLQSSAQDLVDRERPR